MFFHWHRENTNADMKVFCRLGSGFCLPQSESQSFQINVQMVVWKLSLTFFVERSSTALIKRCSIPQATHYQKCHKRLERWEGFKETLRWQEEYPQYSSEILSSFLPSRWMQVASDHRDPERPQSGADCTIWTSTEMSPASLCHPWALEGLQTIASPSISVLLVLYHASQSNS